MMTSRMDLIQSLCDASGISGFESNVRKLYTTYLEPVSDSLLRNHFGGVVGVKTGFSEGPKVLLAGHLDEIGLMVTYITDEGFIKFQPVGGWWSQVMLSQRVVVQTRKGQLVGVIGSKPPHILPADERNSVVKIRDMFIDIGVKDKAEAEAFGVRPGDPITPWGPFTKMANEKYFMGKALDNRLGCALSVEVLRGLQRISHPNVVYAGATSQEEVNVSPGALTLANLVQPDVAIALDVGIAGDTPGLTKSDAISRCGDGPILTLYDATMVPNPRFRDFVMDTAMDCGIKLQVEVIPGGGTDAAHFQTHALGVPSLAIGLPTRYIHSNTAVYNQDDFDGCVELLVEVVKRLDNSVLADLRDI